MKAMLGLLAITSVALTSPAFSHEGHTSAPSKAVATQLALRDLWVDHVFWIRSVVVAKSAKNSKEQDAADKQVVENAKKIAGAIEPFYGKAASDKLFGLLAGHYGAVKEYMNATMPKASEAKQKAATEKLIANANEIAVFLSAANPNLPKDTLVGLLSTHGAHHIAQINQFQKLDYAGEAKTWEDMKQHMYVIADALAGAIAKQFPEKF